MRQITLLILLTAGVAVAQSGPDDYSKYNKMVLYDTSHFIKLKPYNYCAVGKPKQKMLFMDSTWVDSTYVVVGTDTIPIMQWLKRNK